MCDRWDGKDCSTPVYRSTVINEPSGSGKGARGFFDGWEFASGLFEGLLGVYHVGEWCTERNPPF